MSDFRTRRMLLAAMAGCSGLIMPLRGAARNPPTGPGPSADPARVLQFPRDHGSHPDFRIEWWYVTGWLMDSEKRELGFQVTFFRAKPQLQPGNPSAFHPEHIIIAHAALADPAQGRLIHSQRAARAVFGLAGAGTATTDAWLDDWYLRREGIAYRTRIIDQALAIDLQFTATRPLLLQGADGYSRKGAQAASHYYSVPQLQAGGHVRHSGNVRKVSGHAWLDHEWSSSYLPQGAAGWDWIGINLDDGGALMAFRMRERDSGRVLWSAATLRDAHGRRRTFESVDIRFTALREWQSPRSGTRYPVAFLVEIPGMTIRLDPLFDDQESDTRATTGAIYWEGAVRAYRQEQRIGAGYLELTGYGESLVL
jgi:predicted secreted hydrolase